MGRLSALVAPLALLAACDGPKDPLPTPTGKRNEAVVAASSTPNTPAATTSAKPQAPAAPRKLCQDGPARTAPKGAVKTVTAPGATELPASLPFGVGKWVWVNLWAAWCGPCKEEMPRLVNFQSRLRTAGSMVDLAFVSLDDDERQLSRFLEGQPQTGVRASYWLPEGMRAPWLSALGVKETPELPVHALFNPSGQLACLIQGAVEEADYPAIASMLGARK